MISNEIDERLYKRLTKMVDSPSFVRGISEKLHLLGNLLDSSKMPWGLHELPSRVNNHSEIELNAARDTRS